MERDKYLKEVELTLTEIAKDHEIIEIIKESLEKSEGDMVFNSFRYGKGYSSTTGYAVGARKKAGEEYYNKIIKIKKARNLIAYLLLLADNKNN